MKDVNAYNEYGILGRAPISPHQLAFIRKHELLHRMLAPPALKCDSFDGETGTYSDPKCCTCLPDVAWGKL